MADQDPLDAFFEAARSTAPQPDPNLLARVAEDAQSEQAARQRNRPTRGWRGVFEGLGGWPAFAGLATATVAGVWIGVADPTGLDPLSLVGASGLEVAELSPGYPDIEWGDE